MTAYTLIGQNSIADKAEARQAQADANNVGTVPTRTSVITADMVIVGVAINRVCLIHPDLAADKWLIFLSLHHVLVVGKLDKGSRHIVKSKCGSHSYLSLFLFSFYNS